MKKTIVYGAAGSGKTLKFFIPAIENFKGNVIAITNKIENKISEDFIIKDLEQYDTCKLGNEDKFIFYNTNKDGFWINDAVKKLLKNIISVDKTAPLLIAIDEVAIFYLSEKDKNNKSILMNLLELQEVEVLLCLQNLKNLKKIYKDEYGLILKKCDLISTKSIMEFSGEIRLRVPKSLHKELSIRADIEDISLNQYASYVLANYAMLDGSRISHGNGMNFFNKQRMLYKILNGENGEKIMIFDPEEEYKSLIEQLDLKNITLNK